MDRKVNMTDFDSRWVEIGLDPERKARFIPGSEKLRDRARQIADERKITYGKALQIARTEGNGELRFSEWPLPVDPASSEKLRDRARQIADERKIPYGEALRIARTEGNGELRFNESPLPVDPASEELRQRAHRIAGERGVTFGEALRIARRTAA